LNVLGVTVPREVVASIDFETRSTHDIKLGLDHYVACEQFRALVLSGRLPGEEVHHWHRGPTTYGAEVGSQWLERLHAHVRAGGLISAWNAMFEWMTWNLYCVPKLGWPELPLEQVRDSMAVAAAHNLPQSLEKCGEALGLDAEKLKSQRGKYLIGRLCVPHKPTKDREGIWVQDPDLFAELVGYCDQDVVAEESIVRKLRPLTPEQQRVWILTQRINRRGVPVNLVECENILTVVEREKARLNGELNQITQGVVPTATKRDQLLAWVNERVAGPAVELEDPDEDDFEELAGEAPDPVAALENLKGKTVEDALARDDLPPDVRRVLEIRAAVVQTSTAKFGKMLKIASGRYGGFGHLRNLFTYHGAGTGRWASRGGVNAQNFARPLLRQDKVVDEIAAAHTVLGAGDHASALLLWGDRTMDAAVSCLRGVLMAPPGCDFIDADYSSVENRVGVWLAGQDDKVEMFRKGLDEYRQFASKSLYNVPYEAVTKDMRQMSKSAVLGCFAGDTVVLTRRGFALISEVRDDDHIWDGTDFVTHGGVVDQGVKPVVDLAGVRVTPDHLILEGEDRWARADSVDLKSAISLAAGSSSGTSSIDARLPRGCAAAVAPSVSSRSTTSAEVRLLPAGSAPTRTRTRSCEIVRDALTSFLTRRTGNAGSTGASLPLHGATTQPTQTFIGTAAGAFMSAMSGARTLLLSFAGLSLSLAGTAPSWSLTGGTTRGRTPRATAGLHRAPSSAATPAGPCLSSGAASASAPTSSGAGIARATAAAVRSLASSALALLPRTSSPRKPVAEVRTYDIVNCGPRSRFVVFTGAGPVIAHNCMFGQGWRGLIEYSKGYNVFLTDDRSQEVVKAYRTEYARVRELWYECGDAAIAAVNNPGEWFDAGTKLRLRVYSNFLWMELPSGRRLAWARPKLEEKEAPWLEKQHVATDWLTGEKIFEDRPAMRWAVTVESIDTKTRKYKRHPLIGSSIFQSAVQGTAADILADGVGHTEAAGYETVLLAHDENLALVPEGWGDPDEFGRLMCTPEPWRLDLPLSYEAYRAKRFRK
jgi:hypothetical protein